MILSDMPSLKMANSVHGKQQLKKRVGFSTYQSKQISKEDQERCRIEEQKGIRLGEAAIQLGIFSEKQIKTFDQTKRIGHLQD